MIQRATIVVVATVFFYTSAMADRLEIKADCRERPPEMIYDETKKICSGPLIDILNAAVEKVGGKVTWQRKPFQRSYTFLKRGKLDILPRVIKTEKRKRDVNFFTPIGYQEKKVVFAVKKGHEKDIQKFDDLQNYRVGLKRGTFYFDRFNKEKAINKVAATDDIDLAHKFVHGRCHAVIILDIKAFETVMKSLNADDFTYAVYKHSQKIANHYAMSLKSKHIEKFDLIDSEIKQMKNSGQIKAIYQKYGLEFFE